MEISIDDLYAAQDAALTNLLPQTFIPGRSIVTTCYRQEIPGSYILLSEIRRLDMNIPVEVFYRDGELNNDEISELTSISPEQITFKKLNSTIVDFKDRWGNNKGWATKAFAILESQYEENLWIDCDNFPIRNCLDLFDDTEYKEKGSLFWRDLYSLDRADQYCSTSIMWQIFNVPQNDGEPFESGQFLINKSKCWKQLCLMIHFSNNSNIYYNFGGDAECWRMAWQHVSVKDKGYHSQFNYHADVSVPYGFMPYGPFHKGVQNPWHKYGGGTVMVQRDRSGVELFNHRNIAKFRWDIDNPFMNDITNEMNYHMVMRHIKTKYGVK